MTIKSSGSLALTEIQAEFGGSSPISLSEYYRNGAYVTSNNTGVPTSGAISFNQFYNTVRQFQFTIANHVQQADLRTLALAAGWDGSAPIVATVNSGVYLWSDNIGVGGLTVSNVPSGSIINNYGYIIGRGGDGGYRWVPPQNGGPALVNYAAGISVVNMSGAFIAGGGGGGAGAQDYGGDDQGHGGGGAGGGYGAGLLSGRLGGAGGAIGQYGANGQGDYYTGGGYGGGAGGGGGGGTQINGGGGGGGGRILPGSGGAGGRGDSQAGGAGGSAGNVGSNGTQNGSLGNGGGGGGGWGAAGGNAYARSGGAGGAAISGTSVSLTNNGTIYGAVA